MGPKTPEELAAFIEQLKADRKAKQRASPSALRKNKAKNEKYKSDPEYREAVKTRVKVWTENNRERVRATKKRHYERHPEKMKLYARNGTLRKYGLTKMAWDEKFAAQGSKCACCGDTEPHGRWHTDHCHNTDQLRDILCQPCNTMVANHTSERLQLGADYVKRWVAYTTLQP